MRDISSGVWLLQLIVAFIIGAVGAVIGGVFAAFRVDKRIALLEQEIAISINGPAGMLARLANIESALNARRNPPGTAS